MRPPFLVHLVAASVMALGVPLTLLVPTAYADGPTCDGKPVTITVNALSGRFDATTGDDVILVEPVAGDTGVPWHGSDALGIFGDGGDDTICMLVPADTYGGPGDDTILAGGATQQPGSLHPVLDGGPGDDTLVGGALPPVLRGGPGDDELSAPDDANVFEGPGDVGRDTIDVGADSYLDLSAMTHGATVDLATGTTQRMDGTTIIGDGIHTVYGTPYADTLIGTPQSDELRGGTGGDDHLVGGAGRDDLWGSQAPGRRPLESSMGRCTIDGGRGSDQISAAAGTVHAGPGNDDVGVDGPARIALGRGRDTAEVLPQRALSRGAVVRGGSGDDTVSVDARHLRSDSAVRLLGGPGVDALRVIELGQPRAGRPVWEVPAGLFSTPQRGVLMRMHGFSRFVYRGTSEFIGGPGPQYFRGGSSSQAYGGGGNDVLLLGPHHSTAWGGSGHDTCRAVTTHDCEAGPG